MHAERADGRPPPVFLHWSHNSRASHKSGFSDFRADVTFKGLVAALSRVSGATFDCPHCQDVAFPKCLPFLASCICVRSDDRSMSGCRASSYRRWFYNMCRAISRVTPKVWVSICKDLESRRILHVIGHISDAIA